MSNSDSLKRLLHSLDNRSYKAYKDIQGRYTFPDFTLKVDYVQGDPFASPSQLRVQIPHTVAQFPVELYQTPIRAMALRDYLTRQFYRVAQRLSNSKGTGKSGLIQIAKPSQEVVSRTAALWFEDYLEIRFTVGLPARGRTILGYQAAEMLCVEVPDIVHRALLYASLNPQEVQRHVETVEDAEALRSQLAEKGLIAFIADGAILPRRSGINPQPLTDNPIAFQSPDSLRVTLNCPNRGEMTGMGIPQGITLIVGGGYHGKSTLLQAIELGVYNHIPGDGREFVVTEPTAVKIRAEDGRNVAGVDISPFINHLPQGRSTTNFSTENASGSTSQAANIIEALEAGAKVLLVDEDTSATNFMIRDRRMQALIAKSAEPITPLVDKIKQLCSDYGVSTVLVMGGSGDYFDVADTVIAMTEYQPADVTAKARAIAESYQTARLAEGGEHFGTITPRTPLANSLDPSRGNRAVKLKVRDVDEMGFGTENIDLSAVSQIIEPGQLRAIAQAMVYAKERYINGDRTLAEILAALSADIAQQGLDILTPYPQSDLTEFRPLEFAAALNRLRSLQVE
ncbi:MAG: ABC-ATPase domain-containing protein [Desertifilum sp. SIO1I2]|nr:ABC-ATPase domain-containing protein [Desertifilum sp. SIO1I2]